MTAKDFLSQAFVTKKILKAKQAHLEYLREHAMHVNAFKTHSEIKKLLEIQEEIAAVINSVSQNECRVVLFERYINFKKWTEIAKATNYSLRYVHKLHNLGLAIVSKILDTKGD